MIVPKIEATDRTINKPMVSRREERASPMEVKKSFSDLLANVSPRKKLALSFAQRQQKAAF
jgi:predicted CopG family antitoxin